MRTSNMMLRRDFCGSKVTLPVSQSYIPFHDTIQEIGNRLGVADSAYFTKLFTKLTGVSPSSFRNRNLE